MRGDRGHSELSAGRSGACVAGAGGAGAACAGAGGFAAYLRVMPDSYAQKRVLRTPRAPIANMQRPYLRFLQALWGGRMPTVHNSRIRRKSPAFPVRNDAFAPATRRDNTRCHAQGPLDIGPDTPSPDDGDEPLAIPAKMRVPHPAWRRVAYHPGWSGETPPPGLQHHPARTARGRGATRRGPRGGCGRWLPQTR